jgi:Uncharacterized protein conserved in bacteria (DUF2314)
MTAGPESAGGERFVGLLDAEERHSAAPHSFSIPRSDVRRSLTPGSRVKLLFGAGPGARPSVERMWVEVVEVQADRYVGRLDNDPVAIVDLRRGDRVDFRPEHVAALWREVPDAPAPEQFAIVSSRIWRDDQVPVRAARRLSPDPAFSGWLLFAAGDPAVPDPQLVGFEPVTHDALVERYRSFDSIEDEAHGTSWRWDEAALEWRPDPASP